MVLKKQTNIHKDDRKKAIVRFVIDNRGCQKERVIKYCTENGIGSRATIWNNIDELVGDGTLSVIKDEDDRRALKLITREGNLLLSLPAQWEKMIDSFKKYVRALRKAAVENPSIDYNSLDSNFKDMRHYDNFMDFAPTLPYSLIDSINDFYTFYFIFVLPGQNDTQKQITKLYAIYFDYLMQMYSYTDKEFRGIAIRKISDIKKTELYQSYFETKAITPFAKICNVTRASRALNIQDNLFKLLDLVWKSNVETANLLYSPIGDETFVMVCKGILILNDDNFNYNDDSEILQKIHMIMYVVNQFQDSILQHLPPRPTSSTTI